VVDALVANLGTVLMPAFTSDRTGAWDASGVFEGNAYQPERPADGRQAEPFTYETPIERGLGVIPETFRTSYAVLRSPNPRVSFIAYGVMAERLTGPGGDIESDGVEPIRRLMEAGGLALLLGVTHTSSTAVHLAEQQAGRRLFVRHALTPDGVRAVRAGGCGEAFDGLQPHVAHLERRVRVGNAVLRAYELQAYVAAARALIERDPFALLCETCERCLAHRSRVALA
jgi:aminoglycoside 3-N-acetyltransferase